MTAARAAALAAAVVAFLGYAATAARSITWWDGSSYPLAAWTLGIPGAPGSLLLTLLGATLRPFVPPDAFAFALNLMAAGIAAATVAIVAWAGCRLATRAGQTAGVHEAIAGVLGALTFAFALTPWSYATQFTPYGLSALFTALILATSFIWWERAATDDAPRWLFVLALLVGLDISVHRTNLLLLPGLLFWVSLRRPTVWTRMPVWGAVAGGFAAGFAFHLLLIPLAARGPAYNIEDPRDLERWWRYVSVGDKGGGFLVNLFPRRAHFLSVQVMDLVRFMGRNLEVQAPGFLQLAPLGLLLAGVIAAARSSARQALALLALYLSAGLGAVLYFNRPVGYMRTLDRHYLPALVVIAPLLAVGIRALLALAARPPGRVSRALVFACAVAIALVPIGVAARHRPECDLSRNRFAEDFARNMLEPLPERAILFTGGDNDTFPLWYAQVVLGVRRDVLVINVPVAQTSWYPPQLERLVPGFVSSRDAGGSSQPDDMDLSVGTPNPSSPGDRLLSNLRRFNRWQRPVCLAATLDPAWVPWLGPHARFEGLYSRVWPSQAAISPDLDRWRKRLFVETRYDGIADPNVVIDETSRWNCLTYVYALFQLAQAQFQHADPRGCLDTLEFIATRIPPERVSDEGLEKIASGLRAQAEAAATGP